MNSITESTQLLEQLTDPNTLLEVDGKQILVSYAKNTFSTVMATLSSYGTSQQTYDYSQQQQQGDVYQSFYQTGEYPHGYDASTYYEQNGQYYNGNYDYSQYYNGQYAHSTTPGSASQTQIDSTNAAAAVAQAAIAQAHAAKQYQKQLIEHKKISKMSAEERLAHQAQEWTHNTEESSSATTETAAVATTAVSSAAVAVTTATTTTTSEYATYPPPDVSTYQFDESSGYYFDPMTGLYYDANSQYYYNAQTGQFMYWDAEKSTYLPAPSGSEETSDAPNSDKTKKDKEKKEKVKIAKKIAKDMEKWAKTLNAQKEMMKEGTKKIIIPNSIRKEERESATADAGFAILEKVKSAASFEDKKLMPPPVLQIGSTKPSAAASSVPGLVASYGGDSDSEDEDSQSGSQGGKVDESKLVDWSKLACLLCKRQFQSKEILAKHTQFSDLHKQNIEALQGSKRSAAERKEYRDRAKERRQKYGTPAPPEPKKRFEAPLAYEEPTKAGIGQDNIGSKLLQKMGWSAGMGLGKANQGIVKPIETKRRVQNAGLGVRGANVVPGAGDTYKEAVKKTMFARYHDTE